MATVRESWTDERLDDLKESVGDLARRMDSGFAESRMDIRQGAASIRKEMKEEFQAVDARFDAMQGSIDALQRTIIQIGGGMAAAFCAALIGLIATQL
ncbi:MAG TPA: hypothetical protein VIY71_03690 [Solirubrobacterales bacterium]